MSIFDEVTQEVHYNTPTVTVPAIRDGEIWEEVNLDDLEEDTP